ncbi:LysE family translocator [Pararhodospirillum photometricum]|uniref:Translocator protein, LysE family protein n=1 Tax=Pararhodospirillum photometricum DSM 122 TaxID=1150469 RepID=H6SQL4_PARPM|nr:LysE family translocator [Pararhodospirillum photometricum]CCG07329.1 Translocator protein, LysE family protein [Pararhodospirillum photometricum DSM 122]
MPLPSPEFLLTCLVLALLPGTGVVYTLVSSLAGGTRGGLLAAFGCVLGILPHGVAALGGVTALLQTNSTALLVMKGVGVVFLLSLAWGLWRQRGGLTLSPATVPERWGRVVGRGAVINLLNPKIPLFFFAFLPQFLPAETATATAVLGLGLIFMAIMGAVLLMYGCLAARLRQAILTRPSVMTALRRGFAAVFVLFSLRLALT